MPDRKREFASLEEAFDSLSEPIREHSLRVEKYAELIFLELCASEEYLLNINSRVRLRSENRSLVRLAAKYHDIGKVLVPEFYQWADPDYTAEEDALYRRHSPAGEELVHRISQEHRVPSITVDIICESVAHHHENWDGSGFPTDRSEENVPVIGRIVHVADALDHLLMNTRTETPVATAVDMLMEGSGSLYDPIIMGLIYEAKHKLERVFLQYKASSRAIPQATRIIRRKTKRPMWLDYRPIDDLATKRPYGVQAAMRFSRGKDIVGYDEVDPFLRKNKKVQDTGMYFVLDALDTARRMKTCEVGGSFVTLPCVPGFFKKRGMATAVSKLISDTDADPTMLVLAPHPTDLIPAGANCKENCAKLNALGVGIMAQGMPLDQLSADLFTECGIRYLQLLPSDAEQLNSHRELLAQLDPLGVTLIGGDIDRHKLLAALSQHNVGYACGDLIAEYTDEDTFIVGELAAAQ